MFSFFYKPIKASLIPYILIVAIIFLGDNVLSQDTTNDNTNLTESQSDRIILYPQFIIENAANFPEFIQYMDQTKDEYRKKRAEEFIDGSKNGNGEVNTEFARVLLKAYGQFVNAYEVNKKDSQKGVDIELAEQLKSSITSVIDQNLISDKDVPIIFSHGFRAIGEMQNRINDYNGTSYDKLSNSTTAGDIEQVATHYIYGYWSYYQAPSSNKRMIKVSVNLEQIGGMIKTFEAIGDPQGGAMDKIAKSILDYAMGRNRYVGVVNPFPHLKIKQPLSV